MYNIILMDYRNIFNQRGKQYHMAMLYFPHVRQEEFLTAIGYIHPEDGLTLLDAPSGGCYLYSYYRRELKGIRIISVETSEEFYSLCPKESERVLVSSLDSLPFEDASVDIFFSLAGVHHIEDRNSLYKEVHRVLKKGGTLILGDVLENTLVARFLNEFVDTFNSMGHKGNFLSEKDVEQIEYTGFMIERAELRNYSWKFHSKEEAITFCRLLFGLDKGRDDEIYGGLDKYLGFTHKKGDGLLRMNWHLFFIKAKKVS